MSNYVMDIRKKIGHDPLMICGASTIVMNEKGEVLMQRRTDDGTWGYPGGSVELYEPVEEAAKRELFEEVGVIADELELLGVFSGERLRHVYPNGDQASIVDIVFVCRQYHGDLTCQEGEVEQIGFFPLNQLPQPVSPTCMPAFEKMREMLYHK